MSAAILRNRASMARVPADWVVPMPAGMSAFEAMALGTALGIFLGRNPKLDRFFDPWVVLFLNIPALVTIILCYVWFGLVEGAAMQTPLGRFFH